MSSTTSKEEESSQIVPYWLDCSYVQSALREAHSEDSIRIINFQVVPATADGEHYLSDLYRVQLEYSTNNESHKISLIAKTKHSSEENPDISAAADSYDVLSHEILMYETILPKLIAQLATAGLHCKLIPRSIKTDTDHKCLLLEDLSCTSFKMANKRIGLDMDHAKLALKRVAEFHASGARLNEIESGYLQTFSRNAFTTDAFEAFFVSQLKACGHAIRKWPGYELYGEKILALAPNLMDRGRQLFKAESTHFNTFIHSDFWINNMMFKYDASGTPSDCVLIDFQINCWTSPAIDLIYFVNTSLDESIRWDHEEELIRYYHAHLVDALVALAYKGRIPEFKEFWSQYEDKAFNAVTSVCIVLPLILKETDETILSNMSPDEVKDAPYYQPRVNRTLKRLLPVFEQKGLLK